MTAGIDELMQFYFKDDQLNYETEAVPFGLTNITKIVRIGDQKYVARIYNRHTKHIPGIELEAQLTSYLSGSNLSFEVPVFLRTLDGQQFVQFPDGTLGAIVSFLEGSAPELSTIRQAEEFGRVVGELSTALEKFDDGSLSYCGTSFLDIYGLHPLADSAAVTSFMDEPPFPIAENDLHFYRDMLSTVEMDMPRLEPLPQQFVHHDVLIFNLLACDNHIRGVLDFDFASRDVSFMEFAICLNHVLQMSDGSLAMMEAFVKGYADYRKGSAQEIEQLQLLTRIYHIAVLHIYIGQHYSGVSIEQNFNYILNQFRTRNDWLTTHRPAVRRLLQHYLL